MSQECQQPQAHPARCGCEQKKPYPNRLCHIDYAAHPYRCGCLKGNAEAQRRFDEHQHHASAPSAGREVDNSPDGVRLEVFEIVCKERDALKVEIADLRGSQSFRNSLFGRIEAERDALQQRMTIADQRVDDLEVELAKLKRSHEWESQRAAALLEELQDYEGSSGSLQPSLKENHDIPGTSFQRLNALANEGE